MSVNRNRTTDLKDTKIRTDIDEVHSIIDTLTNHSLSRLSVYRIAQIIVDYYIISKSAFDSGYYFNKTIEVIHEILYVDIPYAEMTNREITHISDFLSEVIAEVGYCIDWLRLNPWGVYSVDVDNIGILSIEYVGDYRIITWSESDDAKQFKVSKNMLLREVRHL